MLTEQRACDLILSQLSQRRSYGWEMSELSKDPAIKLFGRTIPLHEVQPNPTEPELSSEPEKVSCKQTKDARTNSSNSDKPDISEDADPTSPIPSTSNNQNEHVKEEVSETTNNVAPNLTESKSQEVKPDLEKALKKPDKIIPCPRCNSMDTKFCYYNNYNVNQPRHFCKNCQRYWTAGGTMRNVPVGAGRRKNKHPSSHYRHIMMSSEALMHQQGIPLVGPTTMIGTDASIGTGVGTVLKFGSEVPLCEPTATVFNIEEERKSADLVMDEQPCASSIGVENKLHACAATAEKNAANGFNDGSSVPPMPCYPGPALMYPWGPVPFPFVPASFWGWPSGPGPWNMPWTAFTNGMVLPSSPINNSSSSVNGSATLGKHSREPATQSDEKLEMMEKKNLWAPKTLRIVDPDEAAKSSIWATLGIKPDDGSIFKSFGAKEKGMCQVTDSGPVLHANPAALSRSRSFQERT